MQVTPKQHQALADVLHSMFCRQPHEDRCSYYWERKWTDSEHKRWLDMATKVLEATAIKVEADGT